MRADSEWVKELFAARCSIAAACVLLMTASVALPTAKQGPESSRVCQRATADGDQWGRGHQLAQQRVEAIRVQACDNYHGPEGSGIEFAAPYLAGQSAAYLVAQLTAWRQSSRKYDPGKVMGSIAKQVTDSDIAALRPISQASGDPCESLSNFIISPSRYPYA